MKSESKSRRYRMTARAAAVEKTAQKIMEATVSLWREDSLADITLQAIADRAGVSVQTVIRRFGSKEGVFDACLESDAADVRVERDRTPVGDVEEALAVLIAHYERDGDAVLRTLLLEEKLDAAARIAATGRREHRKWCSRVFAPFLPSIQADDYDLRVDAFVAATDLFLWKLLRRDLGRSVDETRCVLRSLIDGLISATPENSA